MYGWSVDEIYQRKIVDVTIEHCIEHHGSRVGRFVNAHPGDGLYLEEILEIMPEARVVYVLRHPEEVVWSAIHAPWADPAQRNDREALRQSTLHWCQHAVVAKQVAISRNCSSIDCPTRLTTSSPVNTFSQMSRPDGGAIEAELGGIRTNNSSELTA